MRTVIEFDDECVESVNCDNDEEFVRDHENLSTEFIENITRGIVPLLGPKKVNQGRITLVLGIGNFPRKSLFYI